MTLLPPDLERPFSSSAERLAARRLLLKRDAVLRALKQLAAQPHHQWPTGIYEELPRVTNGVSDPPERRLARWAMIFADELDEVHTLAQHSGGLSDSDLRRGLYFAGRLLATATDLPMSMIDGFDLGLERT